MHWSWFVVAYMQITYRSHLANGYSSNLWLAYEYLALFVIVLLHEFGHSLACRSVGGRADQIILWPLGGVAYVDPPPRPGATLWSIAAGPLVNVILAPILLVAMMISGALHWPEMSPNLHELIRSIRWINLTLLCFNLLPIYPLDGGQILRSILWFFFGRARSLLVASVIGLVATVAAMGYFVVYATDIVWPLVLGAFVLMNAWRGLQQARMLARMDALPRRTGLACPKCKTAPPIGDFWVCGRCQASFDIFARNGVCPNCGTIFNITRCLECGESEPIAAFGEMNS